MVNSKRELASHAKRLTNPFCELRTFEQDSNKEEKSNNIIIIIVEIILSDQESDTKVIVMLIHCGIAMKKVPLTHGLET